MALLVLVVLAGGALRPGQVPSLHRPVDGPVVVGFDAPERFGAGHRGLDLRAPPGSPVVSPVAGRVHHAGPVAGIGWTTLAPTPRVLVTVGPIDASRVRRGDVVAAGTLLGTLAAGHGGAVHLSVRVDGVHVDPAPHLHGVREVELVPRLLRDVGARARRRPVAPDVRPPSRWRRAPS